MNANTAPPNIKHQTSRQWSWRSLVVGLLISLAGLSFVGFVVARWAQHQILSTDGWVSYAAQLPANDDVAWALSDKLTRSIFENVAIEQRIEAALPDRAAFLASPLTDQLQERVQQRSQQVIGSEAFYNLWVGANRAAMDRFLSNARSGGPPDLTIETEKFTIDLSGIRPLLRERLSGAAEAFPALQAGSGQGLAVAADLQAKREQLWQLVRTIDTFYAVLLPAFTAALLAALVLAADRRRAIVASAAVVSGIILVALILIRYFRQTVLDQVQVADYAPAVTFIYDSLLASLHSSLIYGLILWLAVWLIALMAGPSQWAIRVRHFLHTDAWTSSAAWRYFMRLRGYIGRYRAIIWGAIGVIVLVYLAFVATVSLSTLLSSLLLGLAAGLAVQLLADIRSPQVTGVTATGGAST